MDPGVVAVVIIILIVIILILLRIGKRVTPDIRQALAKLENDPEQSLKLLEQIQTYAGTKRSSEGTPDLDYLIAIARYQTAVKNIETAPEHALELLEKINFPVHGTDAAALNTAINELKWYARYRIAARLVDNSPAAAMEFLKNGQKLDIELQNEDLRVAITDILFYAHYRQIAMQLQRVMESSRENPHQALHLLGQVRSQLKVFQDQKTTNPDLRAARDGIANELARVISLFVEGTSNYLKDIALDSTHREELSTTLANLQPFENAALLELYDRLYKVLQVRDRIEQLLKRDDVKSLETDSRDEAQEPLIMLQDVADRPIRTPQMILIPAESAIPIRVRYTFLREDNQTTFVLPIFAGDEFIGEIRQELDPDLPSTMPIELEVGIDVDGRLTGNLIIGQMNSSIVFHNYVNERTVKPVARVLPSSPNETMPALKTVQFTAYYPRTVQPAIRYGIYVYAHLPEAAASIQQDVSRYEDKLGGSIPTPKTAKLVPHIQEGVAITVVPEFDEFETNPPSLTKKWIGPQTIFEFEFTPSTQYLGETLVGRLSVLVGGIEIAYIANVAIEITQPQISSNVESVGTKSPYAEIAKSASAIHYNHIFISYSRDDTQVAESYRLAQIALGNDIFMDTYSLQSGVDWKEALHTAIDGADVFQLFWSKSSAVSDNVKAEWEYALEKKCPETRCVGFIRPVYWISPMPVEPPDELKHLNFKYVPLV